MQHLDKLLAMGDSQIAKFLWSSLHGLEASLKKTQEQFPQDPGADICNVVLRELQDLLQPSSFDSATNQNQNIVATQKEDSCLEDTQPITFNQLKLSRLRDDFSDDQDLRRYLGNFQLHSQKDSELWNEIQHKLLRLPKEIARSWRERALELAQKAQAEIDTSNILQLCFKDNENIYPGLKGTIEAKGLSLSKNVSLDSQLLQENKYDDLLSDDLKLLACLVSICLYFIDIESDLYHALETVDKFDTRHLSNTDTEQRDKYIEALKQRFQRTLKAEENGDSITILKAWINIDEAIHSLVFVPSADPDSWWSELKKESRRILIRKVKKAKEEGHDVRIQELSGVYADIHNLSSSYDLPSKVGGILGEVQACLRVYARINQEKYPGRVIYRSSK
jgi:hypothetical protein